MFGVNVYTAIAIPSFAYAEQYFNKTPQPRGKHWDETTRPLASNRQHHMALERITADQYGVNLYDKRVIIYHRPKDGVAVSEFYATYHQATWAWLWRHSSKHYRNKMVEAGTLREILVPIGTCSNTIIAVNENGEVIPELTLHPQIFTWVSNDEDKAKRKRFKEKLEVVVDMAMMQLHWDEEANKNRYSSKGAFDGMLPASAERQHDYHLRHHLRHLKNNIEAEFEPKLIDTILAVANPAYNYYEERPDTMAFKKNFTNFLIRKAQLDTQSGKKLYPKLPDYDSVPRRFSLM